MPPAQPSPRPGPLDLAFGARGELTAAVLAGSFLLAWWVLDRALHVPGAGPLVWISLGIGMVYGLRAAVGSLARLSFDIDALMVVAAALAAYWGAPGEAALLLFLFVLAGSLEGFALSRTTRAIEALHKLMPDDTLVWRPAPEAPPATGSDRAQGRWVRVPPDELSVGDLLMLPPGETIPADCRLAEGDSAVNQATLTGESLPRVVGPGDELYAGTINVGNPITAQVLRPARDSSLRRILALVLEAQQQREPVQRLIDRLGQPYALGVVGVSVAVLLVWWLVLAEPLIGPRGGALYTAITLLIVLSPCAIIIATPTATLAAITRAAREGVLFKGGQAIDRLASLRALALDKTGTLTIGRPRLVDVEAAPSAEQPALLAIAAGLEAESTHPIAAALREAAALRGIEPEPATSRTSFRAGRGVSGLFRGREARLGTFEHARQLVPPERRDHVRDVMERAQARGDLAVCLATGDRACVFVLTDQVRPGARELVPRLHELNIAPVVMLTGDNAVTARRVADELGLDRWQAQLLPQDKVRALAELRR
ncbi:MAG TPA: heavy metal translocating P-type ATPase, partial [Phycisphaerales bacterium]|nr:heavy metal translocating P-type ATPase [Phycisphaerales bacterium]